MSATVRPSPDGGLPRGAVAIGLTGGRALSFLGELRAMVGGADPSEVLDRTVEGAAAVLSADYVASWRYDARKGRISSEVDRGWPAAPSVACDAAAARSMLPRDSVTFEDASGRPEISIAGAAIASGAIVPVPGHGRRDGSLAVYSSARRAFTRDELLVLEIAAELLGASRLRVRAMRMEADLENAQRQASLGALISGAAHDFNNMVSVVLTGARLIVEDPADRLTVREAAEDMETAALHAAGLSRGLVDLSRPLRTSPEALEVTPIVREVAELLIPMLGVNVTLRLDVELTDERVVLPPGELERILANLVSNARDALPDGGAIEIRARADGEEVVVEVEDDGEGMEPEVLAKAKEPSFTTKRRGHGSGMGLAAVETMVSLAEGSFEVHSEPGRGTLAIVRLPVAAPE